MPLLLLSCDSHVTCVVRAVGCGLDTGERSSATDGSFQGRFQYRFPSFKHAGSPLSFRGLLE